MRRELERDAASRTSKADLFDTEVYDSMITKGVFMLACTRKMAKEKLPPLYHTPNRVDMVFEIASRTVRCFSSASRPRRPFEATC